MKESFYSIAKVAEVEVDIKRSKFIAVASPVDGEAAAISFIEQIKEKHKRATHNVFAYLINEQLMRYSDDGEPAGTAGMPVLEVLKKQNLERTAVVVTRYFGGIKLGAGGLVRAYSDAAKKAVDRAGIVEKRLHQEIFVQVSYQLFGAVKRELEQAGCVIQDIAYGEQVSISCLLPVNVDIIPRLEGITAGKAELRKGEFCYI
ncbi:MAG: YigZ family protein [Thermacetogeniaceae bacterium]|nr:YigZ family protein [Syntrophomonadaceae bacterium]